MVIVPLLFSLFSVAMAKNEPQSQNKKTTKSIEKAKKVNDKKAQPSSGPKVLLETSLGNITLELNPEKAPKTVENFLKYVDAHHYDGTIFHRVISSFMIQGGGFDASMKEKKTGAPIVNEAKNGLSNVRGSIAMARTMDPNSATAQFFINTVDNPFLDPNPQQDPNGYAVFGKIADAESLKTVDKIKEVKTGNSGMHQNVPTEAVVIKKASVVK